MTDEFDIPQPKSGLPQGKAKRKHKIDFDLFERLCKIHCTIEEISGTLGMAKSTLMEMVEEKYSNKFSEIYAEKKSGGKASLRASQFRMAQNNPTMAIWLGKNHLGQKEPKHEVQHSGGVTVEKVMFADEATDSSDSK